MSHVRPAGITYNQPAAAAAAGMTDMGSRGSSLRATSDGSRIDMWWTTNKVEYSSITMRLRCFSFDVDNFHSKNQQAQGNRPSVLGLLLLGKGVTLAASMA
jgi:hypothetical protein